MKTVQVNQFGGTEVLDFVEEPDPKPQSGEIVVEVKAAGINFADIMAREGNYPVVKSVPFRPGYEIAGIVTAVGEGVEGFQGGERVVGILGGMGGYTTHAVLNAQEAIRIPSELTFGAATALLIQGLTAYFLLEHGQLQAGKTVLISSAAGGLGSLAIQMAKRKGAGKIIGLASPGKHQQVRALGADAAIDYTQKGWAQQVLAQTDGKGIDIFLDSLGDPAGEGFDALADKAYWLIYGSQSGTRNTLAPERLGAIVGKNITLRGYNAIGDYADFGRALKELLAWAAEGKLQISVESFSLEQVAQAHDAIANRQTTGKVVLEP